MGHSALQEKGAQCLEGPTRKAKKSETTTLNTYESHIYVLRFTYRGAPLPAPAPRTPQLAAATLGRRGARGPRYIYLCAASVIRLPSRARSTAPYTRAVVMEGFKEGSRASGSGTRARQGAHDRRTSGKDTILYFTLPLELDRENTISWPLP